MVPWFNRQRGKKIDPCEGTGRNPTDRGRCGSKIHLHVDLNGMPVGIELVGANVHDSRLFSLTLESIMIEIPDPSPEKPQNMSLDKGYSYARVEQEVLGWGFQPHIRKIGEEKLDQNHQKIYPARRWVIERTFGWLKGFRALRTRYALYGRNYLAMLRLACGIILFRSVHAVSCTG